jgi:Ca-activated chloride channel family protein
VRANRGTGSADDTDQVPDASRISPPRISTDHPEVAELYMEGRLKASEVDVGTMSSPSHPVILKIAGEHLLVRLAAGADIPDRDFVLRWEEPVGEATACCAWSCSSDGNTYALLQIRAPREVVAAQAPQDVYFLVDRSGSMAGVKWQKCSRALEAFVENLGETDRVWITFFESSFKDFAESPLPRDAILSDTNFKIVELMRTAGGTELLPALKHVHEQVARHSQNRKARIVLITDGQVANEEAVQRLAASRAQIPIYCFGIDTAVNDAVLRAMASRTHGRCTLMTPEDDIVGAVARLSRTLRLPVLSGIGLVGDLKDENPDACFPELCAAEVSTVAVRCGRDDARVEVVGTLANGQSWHAFVDLLPDDTCQAPRLVWARGRINYLLAEDQRKEAVQIACKHNIVCRGASFVAIDEAEKVPVAQRKVYQPSVQREMVVCNAPSLRGAAVHKLDLGHEAWCMADESPRGRGELFKSMLPQIDSGLHDLRVWLVTHLCLPEWIADSLLEIVRSWVFEDPAKRLGLIHAWIANKAPGLDSEHLLNLFENELSGRHRHKAITVLKNLQALLCADNKP